MHTQIINLTHFNLVILDSHMDWNSSNGANQLPSKFVPDTNMPFGQKPRRSQSPSQKFPRVVKPESTVLVLNIVIRKQIIELNLLKNSTSSSCLSSLTSISHQTSPFGSSYLYFRTSSTFLSPSIFPCSTCFISSLRVGCLSQNSCFFSNWL